MRFRKILSVFSAMALAVTALGGWKRQEYRNMDTNPPVTSVKGYVDGDYYCVELAGLTDTVFDKYLTYMKKYNGTLFIGVGFGNETRYWYEHFIEFSGTKDNYKLSGFTSSDAPYARAGEGYSCDGMKYAATSTGFVFKIPRDDKFCAACKKYDTGHVQILGHGGEGWDKGPYFVRDTGDEAADSVFTVKASWQKDNVSAPSGLKAKAFGKTKDREPYIELSWKGAGAKKYEIYRKAGGKNFTYCDTTDKTSYRSTLVELGRKYTYKVLSVSPDGSKSGFSNTVTAVVPVSAPKSPDAQKTGIGKAKITWYRSYGADGYIIHMSDKKDGEYKRIKTVKNYNSTGFLKTGLKAGGTYYFKVYAYVNVDGKKVYSKLSDIVRVRV